MMQFKITFVKGVTDPDRLRVPLNAIRIQRIMGNTSILSIASMFYRLNREAAIFDKYRAPRPAPPG